ncbi:MAG: radical SAM protein [Clostridia bacterium BRH_c25]|nr:MAG: radical SAM protein [Clostridia bacterium BRH_c25]
MDDVKNVMGFSKVIFILKVKVWVFFHYLPMLLKGKLSLPGFVRLLKRLLFFLAKMRHNKFVSLGSNTRVDLYCPGFPSKAFYTACDKFAVFGRKLPCTTVLLSVTSGCIFKCEHCYQKYDTGKDMDIEVLVSTVKKLQDMGIAFFNIEGGEPFLVYERLKKVCQAIDDRSEIWINSTGYGITPERLAELKEQNLSAVMFSLHHSVPEELNKFMGDKKAWHYMSKAVEMCHEAGIAVAFNTCLQREDLYNGRFEQIMEKAKEFKAAIIQLIKPKPAGGWLEDGASAFSGEDIEQLKRLVESYNRDSRYKDYPSISAQAIEESKEQFGCTAGGTDRFYINAKGDVQPCEFLNISFGNIGRADFEVIYEKMRSCFEIPGECWLCEKYSKDILKQYKESKQDSLPLSEALSEEVYSNWDRGNRTELYEKLDNM